MKWNIIPPEIKNDRFYFFIIDLIGKSKDINNILEIGASSGNGSTEALQIGKKNHYNKFNKNINLFSLEVCKERFDLLKNRYTDEFFFPYNISSINIEEFPDKQVIINFYNPNLQNIKIDNDLNRVLGWYDNDINYIKTNNIKQDGINMIKKEHNIIDNFDCVLIDGSEFTGFIEFKKIYGSKYILLDDIKTFKNYNTHQYLKNDNNYKLLIENYETRNGFSCFMKL